MDKQLELREIGPVLEIKFCVGEAAYWWGEGSLNCCWKTEEREYCRNWTGAGEGTGLIEGS